MILVKAAEIAYDIMMNPVVLLIDEELHRALPIWTGPFEANAIAMAFNGVYFDRPLTHDLLLDICDKIEARISMVIINDVIDGNYYAELHIWRDEKNIVIDSRPSDAIALALRVKAPIYLTDKVAEGFVALNELLNEEQRQELTQSLHQNKAIKNNHYN